MQQDYGELVFLNWKSFLSSGSCGNLFYSFVCSGAEQGKEKQEKILWKCCFSISLMRFTAKATTKNMCVMTLLIFVSGFSAFYGMQYVISGGAAATKRGKDFSLHYPVSENQIGKEEIYDTASSYGIEVTDFTENVATNLVVSL